MVLINCSKSKSDICLQYLCHVGSQFISHISVKFLSNFSQISVKISVKMERAGRGGLFCLSGEGRASVLGRPSPRWTAHVSKTGLVSAFGPGVKVFASLLGQIPGFIVPGPIWDKAAS